MSIAWPCFLAALVLLVLYVGLFEYPRQKTKRERLR